jgi:hypothetical protein
VIPAFTQEWCDLWVAAAVGLPAQPGVSGRYEVVVRADDDTTRSYTLVVEDGAITGAYPGGDGADVHREMPEATYREWLTGVRGVMQRATLSGQVRFTGDPDVADALAPYFRSDELRDVRRRVLEQTAF